VAVSIASFNSTASFILRELRSKAHRSQTIGFYKSLKRNANPSQKQTQTREKTYGKPRAQDNDASKPRPQYHDTLPTDRYSHCQHSSTKQRHIALAGSTTTRFGRSERVCYTLRMCGSTDAGHREENSLDVSTVWDGPRNPACVFASTKLPRRVWKSSRANWTCAGSGIGTSPVAHWRSETRFWVLARYNAVVNIDGGTSFSGTGTIAQCRVVFQHQNVFELATRPCTDWNRI
jgi:hypothetical protein